MVGGQQTDAVIVVKPAPQPGDGLLPAEQGLGGHFAQGDDETRIDGFELPFQKRPASLDFAGFGVAVSRWSTFDDVGDVNLLAGQFDGLNDAGQKLAGRPYERLALQILVASGAFTHKDQLGLGVAHPEYDIAAPAAERAPPAITQIGPNGIQ